MIVEMLTRVTNFLIRKSHREVTKGLKYRWITFLRKYPDYYRYLYKTYQQPVVPHLTQIHLELTNRCDLKCKACSNADKSGPKGMMSTQTAKDIIDETMRIAGPGCIMGFYIRGESTLHPDLPGLIDYARSKGFKHLLLSTNAANISKKQSSAILDAGLSELRISIDGVNSDSLESSRCGADFDKICTNMETLHLIRKELGSGCKFRLHSALGIDGFRMIPEFVRKWNHIIHCFRFTVAVNQGGLLSDSVACDLSNLRFAVSRDYNVPCRILYNYVGITWDSRLTSCCVDYQNSFITGQLSEGIKETYENDCSNKMRNDHLSGRFGKICEKCGFINSLVDWFEDEVNLYVEKNIEKLLNAQVDSDYLRWLEKTIAKFEDLADNPPPPKYSFT